MNTSDYIIEKGVNLNQLRVESCIGTILSIKKRIKGLKNVDPVFIFQFNKLESIIPQIKVENITEVEVEKIENATNNLFDQMKTLFIDDRSTEVYDGLIH